MTTFRSYEQFGVKSVSGQIILEAVQFFLVSKI